MLSHFKPPPDVHCVGRIILSVGQSGSFLYCILLVESASYPGGYTACVITGGMCFPDWISSCQAFCLQETECYLISLYAEGLLVFFFEMLHLEICAKTLNCRCRMRGDGIFILVVEHWTRYSSLRVF